MIAGLEKELLDRVKAAEAAWMADDTRVQRRIYNTAIRAYERATSKPAPYSNPIWHARLLRENAKEADRSRNGKS